MLKEPVPCGNPKVTSTMSHQQRSISKDWLNAIFREGKYWCGWCNKNELPKGRRKYCSDDCVVTSDAWCNPNTSSYTFYWLMQRQDWKCEICSHDWKPAWKFAKSENLKWLRRSALNSIKMVKHEIPRYIKEIDEYEKTYDPGLPKRWYVYHPNGSVSVQGRGEPPWYRRKSLQKWLAEERVRVVENIQAYLGLKNAEAPYTWNTPDKIRAYHRELKDNHEPETDHIIPVALGGMAVGFDNVQLICHGCHKIKTRKDNQEIREARKAERTKMMNDNF